MTNPEETRANGFPPRRNALPGSTLNPAIREAAEYLNNIHPYDLTSWERGRPMWQIQDWIERDLYGPNQPSVLAQPLFDHSKELESSMEQMRGCAEGQKPAMSLQHILIPTPPLENETPFGPAQARDTNQNFDGQFYHKQGEHDGLQAQPDHPPMTPGYHQCAQPLFRNPFPTLDNEQGIPPLNREANHSGSTRLQSAPESEQTAEFDCPQSPSSPSNGQQHQHQHQHKPQQHYPGQLPHATPVPSLIRALRARAFFRSLENICTDAARTFFLSQHESPFDSTPPAQSAYNIFVSDGRGGWRSSPAWRACSNGADTDPAIRGAVKRARENRLRLGDYLALISTLLWERAGGRGSGGGGSGACLEAVHRMGNLWAWGGIVVGAVRGDGFGDGWEAMTGRIWGPGAGEEGSEEGEMVEAEVERFAEAGTALPVVHDEQVWNVVMAARDMVGWLLCENAKKEVERLWVDEWINLTEFERNV